MVTKDVLKLQKEKITVLKLPSSLHRTYWNSNEEKKIVWFKRSSWLHQTYWNSKRKRSSKSNYPLAYTGHTEIPKEILKFQPSFFFVKLTLIRDSNSKLQIKMVVNITMHYYDTMFSHYVLITTTILVASSRCSDYSIKCYTYYSNDNRPKW